LLYLIVTNNFITVPGFQLDQTFLMITSQKVKLMFGHLWICIRQSTTAFWTHTNIWRLVFFL